VGIIHGVSPFAALAAQVFWGWLANEIQSRKIVFVLSKFLSTVLLLSLALPSVKSFDAVFIISVGVQAFGCTAVLDAHALDFLGDRYAAMYGTIRMWSFISWGFAAIIIGNLTDAYGFLYRLVPFWIHDDVTAGSSSFWPILPIKIRRRCAYTVTSHDQTTRCQRH
jgi:MFS family permease